MTNVTNHAGFLCFSPETCWGTEEVALLASNMWREIIALGTCGVLLLFVGVMSKHLPPTSRFRKGLIIPIVGFLANGMFLKLLLHAGLERLRRPFTGGGSGKKHGVLQARTEGSLKHDLLSHSLSTAGHLQYIEACEGVFFSHVRTEENFLKSNLDARRPPKALAPCRERMEVGHWSVLPVLQLEEGQGGLDEER